MEIINDKALHLTVRNPQRITTVIPKSKQLSKHELLVYWSLETAQVLRNMGIKNVPSPIRRHYKWPARCTPFKHQVATAEFFSMNRRSFCFSDMGTGKTASAIWAADYLIQIGAIKKVLVICPLSIMESAWGEDIFKFAIHRSYTIAHGSKEKRDAIFNESKTDFTIINFDGIKVSFDAINKANFDLIIVDEANAFKTVSTDRWKALNKLIKPNTWLWMMTGTPAAQSPLDAYGLAKLVNPSGVPKFFGHFRDSVMVKVSTFKWVPKHGIADYIHKVLQPAIRFTKEECLDLPALTYIRRDVEMTPQQTKYYELLREQMLMHAAGEQITAVNAAAGMNKLLQISSGCVYSDTGEVVAFDMSNRYKVLKEILEETTHKVLIFAPFRHIIVELSKLLSADKITNAVIHGGVSLKERTSVFNKFQTANDPRVLVIQPQAAAHGVTLHAADTTVWWGPITSYETYAQANARMHRAGQLNPCTVIQLAGSAVERRVYKMLDNKKDVQHNLLELYKDLLV